MMTKWTIYVKHDHSEDIGEKIDTVAVAALDIVII